jgi:hypothetical protein
LSDIPYYQEIKIPGVDLSNVIDPDDYDDFDEEAGHYCNQCDCELWADDALEGADGEYYCEDCWGELFFDCAKCGETTSLEDAYNTVFGKCICEVCFDAFVESDGNNAQAFANWAEDGIEAFVGKITTEEKKNERQKRTFTNLQLAGLLLKVLMHLITQKPRWRPLSKHCLTTQLTLD